MNDIYSRNILYKLKKWMGRREIFAINGPRQAGKTTLMNAMKEHLLQAVPKENIVFLRCDDFDEAEPFIKDPKTFVRSYVKSDERYYFFLDEYQYVPSGGRILKVLYDTFPNVKFIISGSSSLEIKDKTAKYFVGRVFYFTVNPFSFDEFLNAKNPHLANVYKEKNAAIMDFILKNKNFDVEADVFITQISKLFEEYMIFGGYPEVIKASDVETKKIVLKNIYETYINRDIIELLKITDVIKFRSVVNILASQHSGMLNFESLASDSKSYYRELKRLVSVLEETYILRLLAPFHKNMTTELKKSPKAYFLDSGLRNYAIKNFNSADLRDDKGNLAEGAVLNQLNSMEMDIKYWRTLAKAEVDFVVLQGSEAIPIEVKYQSFKRPQMGRSLRSFVEAYAPKNALVVTKDYWGSVYLGKTAIKFVPICYL